MGVFLWLNSIESLVCMIVRAWFLLTAIYLGVEVTDLRAQHFAVSLDEVQEFLRDRTKDAQDQETMSHDANRTSTSTFPCRRP